MSPFSGEHSCRLAPPGDFREFARKNAEQTSEGRPIDIVYGIFQKNGKRLSKIQSLRYKVDDWTEEQAKAHCQGRKGTFEAAEEEIKTQEAESKTTLAETRKYFFASLITLGPDEHLVDVEILREGSWKHPKAPNGILTLTRERIETFKQNFDSKILGEDLPLDIDHKPAKTGAVGWLKRMWINTKENVAHLFARLDITDPDTQEAVRNGSLKYFSPQIITDYEDPETGKIYDIIRSGALTAWPFIKGMQSAVVNFSEIREVEIILDRKDEASQLLLMEKERDEARKAGKVVAQGFLKATTKIKLQEQVILKLESKTRIDLLASNGSLSPFEAQECRKIALTEPKAVNLAIELLAGRGPAVTLGQLSILSPKKGSRALNLNEQIEALDRIKDPEQKDAALKLVDMQIENMKRERGIK